MHHENGIVVVEVAVSHRGARDMRLRVVAGQFDEGLVPRQPAVRGEREALEAALFTKAREDMRHGAAFVVATLRPDVVKGCTVGHVDLEALVETRGCGTAFKDRGFGPLLQLDQEMQDRVAVGLLVKIAEMQRLRRLAGDTDDDAVRCKGGVERCERAGDRGLSPLFQHAVKVLRPMNVLDHRIGKAHHLHPFEGKVIGRLRVENAIAEDQRKPVEIAERRLFVALEQCRMRRFGRVQGVGAGEAPVFVARSGQAHRAEPLQRRFPCLRRPCRALRHFQPGQPRLGGVEFRLRQGHQTTSERMSA